jgi:hypothetical protein
MLTPAVAVRLQLRHLALEGIATQPCQQCFAILDQTEATACLSSLTQLTHLSLEVGSAAAATGQQQHASAALHCTPAPACVIVTRAS